jgi:hypothetical protein
VIRLGEQHGFDAAASADKLSDPAHPTAYDKRRESLKTLRVVANDHDDRLVALEISVFGESPVPKFP